MTPARVAEIKEIKAKIPFEMSFSEGAKRLEGVINEAFVLGEIDVDEAAQLLGEEKRRVLEDWHRQSSQRAETRRLVLELAADYKIGIGRAAEALNINGANAEYWVDQIRGYWRLEQSNEEIASKAPSRKLFPRFGSGSEAENVTRELDEWRQVRPLYQKTAEEILDLVATDQNNKQRLQHASYALYCSTQEVERLVQRRQVELRARERAAEKDARQHYLLGHPAGTNAHARQQRRGTGQPSIRKNQ